MSKRRAPRGRGMDRTLEQLSGMVKRGATMVSVAHDDWCRIFVTGRFQDCNCNPDLVSVRPVAAPKPKEDRP
jgi:hypothetical protein